MVTVRPRTFTYAVTLDRDRAATSDRGGAVLVDDESAWTPEHLLLTALARCVLTSLDHHAERAGVTAASTAAAAGKVTRRETDQRFAFVEIDVECTVELDPPLEPDSARELVAKAERDCFVAASLAVVPRYRWIFDGEPLA
ncbi:MAG TPA: OsmC family protein [Gaiellaceae bacterium]|nr:OsmC family protein [Gaiellaceae bacterium]